MSNEVKITAVKGMPDVLPEQISAWQYLENEIRQLMHSYAYNEIRTPILERTQLFKRSIGEVTDIVEKEMFSFPDQNGDSLTLRPEGTASCVRACIEHSLLRNQQQQKLWYMGPMFRYERPQKGRYRQFYQLGVEAFNQPGPEAEAEHLAMCARLWKKLNLESVIELQINSLGNLESRNKYKQELVAYFNANADKLDEDSKRRLLTNPLRILDSKNPEMQELITKAPVLLDFLDHESQQHFDTLQKLLNVLGVKFKINPRIVRGLDYYNRTVYEWITDKLGSQSAVCAGGRFDNLVGQLGGSESTAVGFAMGLERIILLLQTIGQTVPEKNTAALILLGDKAMQQHIVLAEKLRDILPNTSLQTYHGGNGFSKANKSGANFALIIGDQELADGTISVKCLRQQREQETVPMTKQALDKIIGE